MRDLVFFNEPDHLQGVGLVHDHVGGADIQVRHEKAVQLGAVKQGQRVKAHVVGFVLAVENATVVLGHQRPVRQHRALGFGFRAAGVGNLHNVFGADLHLGFVVGHGLHFRHHVEEAFRHQRIPQREEAPFFDRREFRLVLGDDRIQNVFHNEDPGSGVIDDVSDLFGVEHVIDGNLDGADLGQTHHADGVVMGIVRIDRHPVALPDAVAGHEIGKAPGLPLKIIKRNFHVAKNDGDLVAVFGGRPAGHVPDRIPIANVAHVYILSLLFLGFPYCLQERL